ncbi:MULTISPECIES: hypothetical protein [unclassified Dysgonomonas]|uniref:hypothetical protein n=1 Tax=unclassified Dysgonomonas TaxID=2630389 RepID=UPI0013EDEF2E|nr:MULTISPECIES: hypothetical protein [unclassified Dysgonomonas]
MLEKDKNKANPFRVPENYFENFNASIMDKLPEKERKVAKIVPLWKKVLPWTAIAAVFAGVIFSTGIIDHQSMPNDMGTKDIKDMTSSASSISSVDEEDFYLFLQEEAMSSAYDDAVYSID